MGSQEKIVELREIISDALDRVELDRALSFLKELLDLQNQSTPIYLDKIESIYHRYRFIFHDKDPQNYGRNSKIMNTLVKECNYLFGEISVAGIKGSPIAEALPTSNTNYPRPLKVFLSYSHIDSQWKIDLMDQFVTMRELNLIEIWHDGKIEIGTSWNASIEKALFESEVIVFLVSPALINSNYIKSKEMPMAFQRRNTGQSIIVPIFIRHIDVEGTIIGEVQGFPEIADGYQFLSEFPNRDEGLYKVAKGFRKKVETFKETLVRNAPY